MPARGVAPAAPAAPVGLPAPPPATAGLPQSTFWGSLFQGLMQAPAYEQQQLQLDVQRLQNYEQYYNAIVPQVLANRPLAGDQRMISILSTAAKQAGVPAPITIVNGKPQIDVDALGRQALNNFIEKNSDLWYGKWSSTQRVSFAQRMGWIPPGYDWQKDDAFTAQQSETLPEQQRTHLDYIRALNTAVKSNDPITLAAIHADYDQQFGRGAFEKAVPGYKLILKQVANNYYMQAKKLGLDLTKEMVEINNDLLRGDYLKAETNAANLKAAVDAYNLQVKPELDASLIAMRSAVTRKAIVEAQNALTSGQKLPASFQETVKNVDTNMSNAVKAAQDALASIADAGVSDPNDPKFSTYSNIANKNLAAIRAMEPEYFESHLLLDWDTANSNPNYNLPIPGTSGTVKDALAFAAQLLQVRTTQGVMAAKKYWVKASKTWNPVVKWLTVNYPDLMNYIRGEHTTFEKRAMMPSDSDSTIPTPQPSPLPSGQKQVMIPIPPTEGGASSESESTFLEEQQAEDSGGSDNQ